MTASLKEITKNDTEILCGLYAYIYVYIYYPLNVFHVVDIHFFLHFFCAKQKRTAFAKTEEVFIKVIVVVAKIRKAFPSIFL